MNSTDENIDRNNDGLDEYMENMFNNNGRMPERVKFDDKGDTKAVDDSRFGEDRLGYSQFARALAAVAKSNEAPDRSLAVGIFANWGSGKSFLMEKLRDELDIITVESALQHVFKDARVDDVLLRQYVVRRLRHGCDPTTRRRILVALARVTCGGPLSAQEERTLKDLFEDVHWYNVLMDAGTFHREKRESKVHTTLGKDDSPREKKAAGRFRLLGCLVTLLRRLFTQVSLDSYVLGIACLYVTLFGTLEAVFQLIGGKRRRTCDGLNTAHKLESLIAVGRILPCLVFCQRDGQVQPEADVEEKERVADVTYPITVHFNAWVYNGSDVLWAGLVRELFGRVEDVFGKERVRSHRMEVARALAMNDGRWPATVTESPPEKRAKFVDAYVRKCNARWKEMCDRDTLLIAWSFHLLLIGLVCLNFLFPVEYLPRTLVQVAEGGFVLLPVLLGLNRCFDWLKDYIAIVRKFGASQGDAIFQKAKMLNRSKSVQAKLGFMNDVKTELLYLYDFLQTQSLNNSPGGLHVMARLSVYVDDIDRCDTKSVMAVLEATILLLVDAPITCFLAIDPRMVTASIENHFGESFVGAGFSGYEFLDKIVQLPFTLPEPTLPVQRHYLHTLVSKSIDSQGVIKRLHGLMQEANEEDKVDWERADWAKVQDRSGRLQVLASIVKQVIDILDPDWEGLVEKDHGKQVVQSILAKESWDEQALIDMVNAWMPVKVLKDRFEQVSLHATNHRISMLEKCTFPGQLVSNRVNDVQEARKPEDMEKQDPFQEEQSLQPSSKSEVVSNGPLFSAKEALYVDVLAGFIRNNPRHAKRVINAYSLQRHIINSLLGPSKDIDIVYRKGFSLSLAVEQWPVRMAWLFALVDAHGTNSGEDLSFDTRPSFRSLLLEFFQCDINTESVYELLRRFVNPLIRQLGIEDRKQLEEVDMPARELDLLFLMSVPIYGAELASPDMNSTLRQEQSGVLLLRRFLFNEKPGVRQRVRRSLDRIMAGVTCPSQSHPRRNVVNDTREESGEHLFVRQQQLVETMQAKQVELIRTIVGEQAKQHEKQQEQQEVVIRTIMEQQEKQHQLVCALMEQFKDMMKTKGNPNE